MNALGISKEELKELYDKDYPLWAEINLELLKEKQYDMIDWENVIEEINDMGLRHLESCISYLAVILEHIYKWDNFKDLAGGETAGNGWVKSVENARDKIKVLFKRHPSLQTKLPKELQNAWDEAITELKIWLRNNDYNPDDFTFPKQCPYTYEEAMTRDLRKEI